MLSEHCDIAPLLCSLRSNTRLLGVPVTPGTRTAVGNGPTLLDHLGIDRENRKGGEREEGGGGGREEQ